MRKQRGWVFQGLLVLSSLSFVGAKGCVFDGDASLGSDDASGGDSNEAGASTSSAGSLPGGAGKSTSNGKAGAAAVAGSGAGGSSSSAGTPSSEGGAEPGAGGEPAGGAGPGVCALEIVVGPCDAAIARYAYDTQAGKCVPFTYGGCEGNGNNFATLEACEAQCGQLTCPSFLQTDTVYAVQPLNRPERACIMLSQPIHVTCSMLLNPSLTVPTNWPTTSCVNRNGTSFYAGTTLPKAEGWSDCSPAEAELVDQAPDCADL